MSFRRYGRWNARVKEAYSNVLEINHPNNLPAPEDIGYGVGHNLVDGKHYRLNKGFEQEYTIIWPGNYGVAILSSVGNGLIHGLTKTTAGPMFKSPNGEMGLGEINGVTFSATHADSYVFDFESDTPGLGSYISLVGGSYGVNVERIGYIKDNMSFDIFFSGFIDTGYGLELENTDSVSIGGASWWTGWKNYVDSTKITMKGANLGATNINWFTFEQKSNEYAFDIKSDTTMLGMTATGGIIYGGTSFAPGSKTQKDPYINFSGNSGDPGIADSSISGGLFARGNTTDTDITVQGAKQNFQSVQDAGGGQLQINTDDTTDDYNSVAFANGDIIWLPNSIYAGKYIISNLVADTSFEITAAYIEDASGEYHKGWTKIAGTTIQVDHSERASQTDNNEITLSNLAVTLCKCLYNYTVEGAATADKVEICIIVDDDIISESIKSRTLKATPAEGFCDGSDEVVSGDTITAYVRNMDSATRNILFSHFHLSTNK